MQDVFTDLVIEGDELDAVVADLASDEWELATPAPGWTIAHQVAHLAFIAHLAGLAASDPEAFEAAAAPARKDFQGTVDAKLAEYLAEPPAQVLERWRAERTAADRALAALPAGAMVPWLVNPLPAGVLAAAGLMELYGHGQDILDALGIARVPTDRIGHLAFFGTRTRDFGYLARGLEAPAEEFRFELTAPSGQVWAFGPEDAEQKVSGPAADFCLLITRRRHRDDLALTAIGAEADHWLSIAQAYRGPAGEGRKPAQFATA
jgi:uncharacterized protein (TIGR03084 family)